MATSYREDLVRLLETGTPKAAIMAHFISIRHLSARATVSFLKSAGIGVPLVDPMDNISDERRRYLNDLSIS